MKNSRIDDDPGVFSEEILCDEHIAYGAKEDAQQDVYHGFTSLS